MNEQKEQKSSKLLSGASLLTKNNRFGAQLRTINFPCSAMVAAWLHAVRGGMADTIQGWHDLDPIFWALMNVWEGCPPWSGVATAYLSVGSDLQVFGRVDKNNPAPELRDQCWHVVQRWGVLGDDREDWEDGHCYLVWRDGDRVVVHESDSVQGYRVTEGTWSGTAGLDGYSVGVAYLKDVPE